MSAAQIQPSSAPAKLPDVGFSQSAIDAAHAQIKKRAIDGTSLRVGVRGGGCSGFSYVIEFHDGAPHARDRVYDMITSSGEQVRFVVDPKSLVYLNGAVLEFEKKLVHQGFKWANPNEKSGCGCGHSFSA